MQARAAPRNDGAATHIPMWERILVVYCLFHFSEGLWSPLFADPTQVEGTPLLRMAWYPIYLIGLIGFVRTGEKARNALMLSGFHVGLLVLAFASTAWSVVGDATFRRAFALLMTSMFGVYMASRYTWKEFIVMFASAFAIMAVASFIASAAFPAQFVDQEIHIGAWEGIWGQKNSTGAFMARGTIICLCAALVMPDRRWMWRFFAALCVAMVLLSTSKTSLIALVLGLALIVVIAQMRKGPHYAFFFGYAIVALAVMVACVLVFAPQAFFDLIGRDSSLTGRTDIWNLVERSIMEKPILGHGYAAFWQDARGPALYIRQALQWPVPNAHNGWLEIALGMGFLGVTLAVGLVSMIVWRVRGVAGDPVVGPFAIPLVALGLVFSMSESAIAQQNSLNWMLLIAIGTKLAMDEKRRRDSAPVIAPGRLPSGRARSAGVR
ncbi:MAG: O-antigen ligase [Caulobacterales bacterium]